jgi:hypothetical protein
VDELAADDDIALGSVEGLVTATLVVVDVLANDAPVALDEGRLSQDPVGMAEAVQNEPGIMSEIPVCLSIARLSRVTY